MVLYGCKYVEGIYSDEPLIGYWLQRVAVAVDLLKEGFGTAEVEVEVETDGEVVAVIADVEGDDLVLFVFLVVLYKREDQTVVVVVIVGFDSLLAAVNQGLWIDTTTCGHGEMDFIAYLIIFGPIGTGLCQNAEHVEDATFVAVVHLIRFSFGLDPRAALMHVGATVCIREPGFVDGEAFALFGRFAEVERFEELTGITGQGVAHLEEEVALLAADAGQGKAIGGGLLIGGFIGGQAGNAHLFPDELPVEIEVINHLLSTLKGLINSLALRQSYLRNSQSKTEQ